MSRFLLLLVVVFVVAASSCDGKIFERCQLAKLLQRHYGLPPAQVATLVCIAEHSSGLNTAAYGGGSGPGGGSHGLFQISDVYWCSPGTGCGLNCAKLRDDDITDDVYCVRKIYAEHQRISGDGFTAWQAYEPYCRYDAAAAYISNCPGVGEVTNQHHHHQYQQQPQQHHQHHVSSYQQSVPATVQRQGKIYSRCELAQELYYRHQMPMQEIPTWVCIAQHESSYNTAAVGRLNADGSADHGLFQISDLFWCTHDQREGGKGCHTTCDKFLDTNIADDVQCIKRIHKEHTQISGDGFNAWTVYNRNCRNQRYEQVAACFTKPHQQHHHHHQHPNAIDSVSEKYGKQSVTLANPFYRVTSSTSSPRITSSGGYQSNPFLRQRQQPPSHPQPQSSVQSHPNAIPGTQKTHYSTANPFAIYKQQPHYTNTYTQQHQQQQQQHYYQQTATTSRLGKVYTRCELAKELFFSHKFPMQDIATWVCIAEHESRLDTAAVGRLNGDGSADHGLFQISDLYWCSHDGGGGKGCQLPCQNLVDGNITDDVQCIRTIYEEHTRLSGDGFTAWTVYDGHCRYQTESNIANCFDDGERIEGNELMRMKPSVVKAKGKIYGRCELAQELYYRHQLPMEQIPTWVCIAEHESRFNTAAVGRLNGDGSADHGLFQISDLFWCSHNKGGSKACHIECDKLLDEDIGDDVKCIRTIYEEHTQISGDGFNAWTVYQPYCQDQNLAMLSDCFKGNEITDLPSSSSSADHYGEKPQLPPPKIPQRMTTKMINTGSIFSYSGNPFLMKFGSTTTTTSRPPTINDPLFKKNPFLSNAIRSKEKEMQKKTTTAVVVAVEPTKQYVQITRPPQQSTRPYVSSDSFRHELKGTSPSPTQPSLATPTWPWHSQSSQKPIQTSFMNPESFTTTPRPIIQSTTRSSSGSPSGHLVPPISKAPRPTRRWQTTRSPSQTLNLTTNVTAFTKSYVYLTRTSSTTTKPITTTPATTRQTTTLSPRTTKFTTLRTTTRATTTRSPTTTRSTTRHSIVKQTTIIRPTTESLKQTSSSTTRLTTRTTTANPATTKSTTRKPSIPTTTTVKPITTPRTTIAKPTTMRTTTRTHPTTTRGTTVIPRTTKATTIKPSTTRATTMTPRTTKATTVTPRTTKATTVTPRTTRLTPTTPNTSRTTTIKPSTTRATTMTPRTTKATTVTPRTTRFTFTTPKPITTRTSTSTTQRSATNTTNKPTTMRTTSTPPSTTTRSTTRTTTINPTTRKIPTTRPTTNKAATKPFATSAAALDFQSTRPTNNLTATTTRRPTTRPFYQPETTTRSKHLYSYKITAAPPTAAAAFASKETSRPSSTTVHRFTQSSPATTSNRHHPTTQQTLADNHRSPPTANTTYHQGVSSTTPKPYLFTTSTKATTTPTTKRIIYANPFDHPFFAKFNEQFEQIRAGNISKSTTKSNQPHSKTVYSSYAFGLNSPLNRIPTTTTSPVNATTTKTLARTGTVTTTSLLYKN